MAQSLKLCASPDELRARWADAGQRNFSLSASNGERAGVRCRSLQLAERGIDFATVAAQAGKPEADCVKAQGQRLNAKGTASRPVSAFSLQHSAFPNFTRRQRADRLKQQHVAFFEFFAPEAREILDELLEKYATDGPPVLRPLPPDA